MGESPESYLALVNFDITFQILINFSKCGYFVPSGHIFNNDEVSMLIFNDINSYNILDHNLVEG